MMFEDQVQTHGQQTSLQHSHLQTAILSSAYSYKKGIGK